MGIEKEVEDFAYCMRDVHVHFTGTNSELPMKVYQKIARQLIKSYGYRKVAPYEDIINELAAKVRVLQSERDNLMHTVDESPEVIEDAKQETAEEIVDLLIKNDDGDCNSEAIKLIVERYGLQEYIKENFAQFEEVDDDGD